MPNIRWLLALITLVHRFLYRISGGRIGASMGKTQVLLLTHVGRKTGTQRVTPLLFVEDGDRWVVVASNAGDDRNPAWWLNLKSRPEAVIQIRNAHHHVRAREADPQECERLWPRLEASYKYYADYRQRTDRMIPIVLLERA